METVETNLDTLSRKQKIIGAIITLEDGNEVTIVDYEADSNTKMFKIQDSDGDVYPVPYNYIGKITADGLTKPTGNRSSCKKLKRIE